MKPSAIPAGHNTVSPYLVVRGAGELIDFLKQTFGAEELGRMPGPNGTIMHAEVRIGDTVIMIGDAGGDTASRAAMLHCYVEDCDAVYARALRAGATSTREPVDMFYGDRTSMVQDRFGNSWAIATHKEDLSPEEMARRVAAQKKA